MTAPALDPTTLDLLRNAVATLSAGNAHLLDVPELLDLASVVVTAIRTKTVPTQLEVDRATTEAADVAADVIEQKRFPNG